MFHLQNDFFPFGSFEIDDTLSLIPVINDISQKFKHTIAIRAWHPADHFSFASSHLWRKVGQVMEINGQSQQLFPMHAVQNSFGAEFHPKLKLEFQLIIDTGIDKEIAKQNTNQNKTNQYNYLREYINNHKITHLYLAGIDSDNYIFNTISSLHSKNLKFTVFANACRFANNNNFKKLKNLKLVNDKELYIKNTYQL